MDAFQRAIDSEDGLSYLEPKDWPIPARHFAGACLLKLGKAADAEHLYREDLAQNPGNGWTLFGLAQSFAAQHKDQDAADYRARAIAAFAQAEQLPPASAY
jgi:tetratricopeptide (TPR) repeat protein